MFLSFSFPNFIISLIANIPNLSQAHNKFPINC